jgi:hypothetical protein
MYSWEVDVNHTSSTDSTYVPYVICGSLIDYSIVEGAQVANPAGSDTTAVASCPPGTVVLAGGVSNSDAFVTGGDKTNINSTAPSGNTAWQTSEDNGSSSSDAIAAFATCAL